MPWQAHQEKLDALQRAGLRREIRAIDSPQSRLLEHQGKTYLNFSANNYLGLANDPRLREAMIRGVRDYGVGSGAARLINGSLRPFHDLENILVEFKGSEAALVFNSGYQANLGALSCLLGEGGCYFSDSLNHASIIDGIRLSKAEKIIYPHGDAEALKELIQEKRRQLPKTPMAIVSESVFSMDGDLCPLEKLFDLAEEFDLLLYLDEAHATGVFGDTGSGLAEAQRSHPVFSSRLIQMGTLGKALGCYGAYVAGSRVFVDFLINRSRNFIFTTALPPAVACAATEAIKIVQKESERRTRLWQRLRSLSERLGTPVQSPIIPMIIGEEQATLALSELLQEQGYWVGAIRPPTVPPGTSRLRITVMVDHEEKDLEGLVQAMNE